MSIGGTEESSWAAPKLVSLTAAGHSQGGKKTFLTEAQTIKYPPNPSIYYGSRSPS